MFIPSKRRIATLINLIGEVKGRVELQKIIFILQNEGIDFGEKDETSSHKIEILLDKNQQMFRLGSYSNYDQEYILDTKTLGVFKKYLLESFLMVAKEFKLSKDSQIWILKPNREIPRDWSVLPIQFFNQNGKFVYATIMGDRINL